MSVKIKFSEGIGTSALAEIRDFGVGAKRACAIFDCRIMGPRTPKYKAPAGKNKSDRISVDMLYVIMRINPDRAILTVLRHAGSWVVEYGGEHFDHSPDKEIAKAAAHKRARQLQDSGRLCQVRVAGDFGRFAVR